VGFGLTAEEGATVACLADSTGGVYIEASNASTLKDALQATVVAEPPPPPPPPTELPTTTVEVPVTVIPAYNFAPTMVLKQGGPVITDGSQSWELFRVAAGGQRGDGVTTSYGPPQNTVDPGDYILLARLGLAEVELPLTLTAEDVTAPVVVMNAGTLVVHPRGVEGGLIETGAAVQMTNAAGLDWTSYGDTNIVIPAGDIKIVVTLGTATVEQVTEIAPGQTVELEMIAGAGLAVVDGYYVEGMLMDTTQHSVEIVEAKKSLDGSRRSVTTSYGPAQNFTLPPGDYVAVVKMDAAIAETPFTVKIGERVDVPVVLNAGVLFVSAPGATSIEVYDSKVDLQGNRTSRAFNYAGEINVTAPGGDYLIQVKMPDDSMIEATASVKPGERTEITIP
jgi:Ca-activated chloride channel homolog